MFKRINAIIIKEFYHIFRDMRSLAIVIAMPIMMVLLYGYALNMDVKNISIVIVDYEKTPESRDIIRTFSATKYFHVVGYLSDTKYLDRLFRQNKARGAIVIPEGFGKASGPGNSSDIQIIVDGSDPTFGNAMVNYSTAILLNRTVNISYAGNSLPFEIREKYLFNPDLRGSDFIIPGIVAIILMMVCALLTSITISREKESGTMDILMVSPVRPYEVIFAKVIPYVFISFVDAVFYSDIFENSIRYSFPRGNNDSSCHEYNLHLLRSEHWDFYFQRCTISTGSNDGRSCGHHYARGASFRIHFPNLQHASAD